MISAMKPLLTLMIMAACAAVVTVGVAAAEPVRVALVVGNGDYKGARLRATLSDARRIARTLRRLQFDVVDEKDLDLEGMQKAIEAFGARLQAAGPESVGVFYYGGHGVQVDGQNYLVPIGAKNGSADDLAVSVASVLSMLEEAGNGFNFVFLDASYDFRYGKSLGSGKAGLVRMKAPDGTLVGFSAAPDKKAIKTVGDNTHYALGLTKLMQTEGTSVTQLVSLVQRYVMGGSLTKQIPWAVSSLKGEFFFSPAE